jgi:hypothetical protein
MLKVVADIGVMLLQASRCRVNAITLLGHGQADDPYAGISHCLHHRNRIFRGHHNRLETAHDARRHPRAILLQRSVEPSLRHETVALIGTLEADAGHSPIAGFSREEFFRIRRLVCADEGAEAKMNDAGAKPAAIIGWHRRSGLGEGKSRGRKKGKIRHRFLLIRHR